MFKAIAALFGIGFLALLAPMVMAEMGFSEDVAQQVDGSLQPVRDLTKIDWLGEGEERKLHVFDKRLLQSFENAEDWQQLYVGIDGDHLKKCLRKIAGAFRGG